MARAQKIGDRSGLISVTRKLEEERGRVSSLAAENNTLKDELTKLRKEHTILSEEYVSSSTSTANTISSLQSGSDSQAAKIAGLQAKLGEAESRAHRAELVAGQAVSAQESSAEEVSILRSQLKDLQIKVFAYQEATKLLA